MVSCCDWLTLSLYEGERWYIASCSLWPLEMAFLIIFHDSFDTWIVWTRISIWSTLCNINVGAMPWVTPEDNRSRIMFGYETIDHQCCSPWVVWEKLGVHVWVPNELKSWTCMTDKNGRNKMTKWRNIRYGSYQLDGCEWWLCNRPRELEPCL